MNIFAMGRWITTFMVHRYLSLIHISTTGLQVQAQQLLMELTLLSVDLVILAFLLPCPHIHYF